MGEFSTVMQTRDEVTFIRPDLDATTMFTYSHTNTPIDQSERAYYFSYFIKICLHGGEVKYGGSPHLSCKRNQIKMRDYMDKRATSPHLPGDHTSM